MTTTEHRSTTTAVRSSLLLPRVGQIQVLHAKPLRERSSGNLLTTGSNQLRVRDHNQLLVLQAIRVQGPLTRRALAHRLGFDASRLISPPGYAPRSLPQTCRKQFGIRLMFLVNPQYHCYRIDSCLMGRCRVSSMFR